jgi:signal transduction histidine kinase
VRRSIGGALRRFIEAVKRSGLDEQNAELSARHVELQHALRELAAEKETIQQLIDSALDGIRLIDADGAIIAGNNRMSELLAAPAGIVPAGSFWDQAAAVAPRTTNPAAYRAAIEDMREHPDEDAMYEFELADTGRVLQRFTRPISDAAGTQTGRIVVLRDMTSERELRRMKDEFVATVTHELRTPLTSIAGYLELLLEDEQVVNEQRGFLVIVERNSKRLLSLVNDLLFVAQVDSTALELELGVVNINRLLEDAVGSARPAAEARQLALDLSADTFPSSIADGPKLAQLVDNLISNAVKFTPPGGRVTISATLHGDRAAIVVSDTGIGIPEPEKPHLFERFFRASTAISAAVPGTGLGLAITKAITEAHGGTISAEDTPGGGTTFRLELPLVALSSTDVPTLAAA